MIVYDLFKDCNIKKLTKELVHYSDIFKKEYRLFNRRKLYKKISNTINDILSLTPIISDDFIYVVMCYDIDVDEKPYLAPSIVHKDDILKYHELIRKNANEYIYEENRNQERPEPYSLMFIKREELLGYQFSTLSLRKYNKYKVIAALFYELTWFGYDNETCEENSEREQEELEERVKDSKEHPEHLIPFDEAMTEIFGEQWKEWQDEYVPPTEEEIAECVTKNMKEVYEEYNHILNLIQND